MTVVADDDQLDRLLSGLEREILSASDRDVLESDAHRLVAEQAKAAMAKALAVRQIGNRRRPARPVDRSGERRELMQQLLVASPKARDLIGSPGAGALSDADVEAFLARFAAAGLLPPAKT